MIITVSGAIGNGKNKILSTLAENDYNVITMRGSDGSLQGQLDLINRYVDQMKLLKKEGGVHIFESSFVDILIYTTFLYGIYSDDYEPTIDFENLCIRSQESLVDLNIRLDGCWSSLGDRYHGLPTIEIWNVAAEHYFTSRLPNSEEYVLSGDSVEELMDHLHGDSKALEYLSKETLRVVQEYASKS